MCKTAEYRYVTPKGENEKKQNIHIREMIEMLKNEKVRTKLNVNSVRLSRHAMLRMNEHFETTDIKSATVKAKEMLKNAVRIGTVLAYDGRINVLYAYRQTAFFLSPDLKTLVTVNRYPVVTYRQLLNKVKQGADRDKLIEMHSQLLQDMESKEREYMKKILAIEERVRETSEQVAGFISLMRGKHKHGMKSIISELNLELKTEGRKLFELKIEKRHVCKSLVALY